MTEGRRGYTGATGENGYRGATGLAGEQGRTGPDGPTGVQGRRGHQGVVGLRGRTGNALSKQQNLVMFLFVVMAFILLAVFNQNTADKLSADIAMQCQQRTVNVLKQNANWDAMAEIEKHNQFIDERIRAQRLQLYSKAKLTVPTCGEAK